MIPFAPPDDQIPSSVRRVYLFQHLAPRGLRRLDFPQFFRPWQSQSFDRESNAIRRYTIWSYKLHGTW